MLFLKIPNDSIFYNSGAGADQIVELPDSDILIPGYLKAKDDKRFSVTIIKSSFDGKNLTCKEHENILNLNVGRGLVEPSLTCYNKA